MAKPTLDAQIRPHGHMETLSRREVARLRDVSRGGLRPLLRRCALATLTSGYHSDDPRAPHQHYPNFDIDVVQDDRGLVLALTAAPAESFIDGVIIRGVAELLFAVVRDIVYIGAQIEAARLPLADSASITEAVFEILRNARLLRARTSPNLIVCWGGHSIARHEYEYTKKIGYELGLRELDICTGCGPGAMKGPMKGATIGHAKQRRTDNRYIGVTEPDIISAEPPNPIVNELVIMPDMEKRLEAFVRLSHGIIVFPGGVGTAEEILYILGIMMHPDNSEKVLPLVLTGPPESADYFQQIDRFLRLSLGAEVADHYQIIIADPVAVGAAMSAGVEQVRADRRKSRDAFFYNWSLTIDPAYQLPFEPTHANIAALELHRRRPAHLLAADLRRTFSAIVSGNLKERWMQEIEEHGPYLISGEPEIMEAMDALLQTFVDQQRMKLPGSDYHPCYRVVA